MNLGEHYDALLPDHVVAAAGLIASTTQDIEDADMGKTPSASATSEANDFFLQFTLVSIQETKFSSSDAVRQATHFSKVCDSKSISFWSTPRLRNFRLREDEMEWASYCLTLNNVTYQYVTLSSSTLISHRYLVIQARTDDINLYIHVVYAPVQVADRKVFNALPTRFPDDCHHLTMGDFNVPMDPILDEVKPYMHDLGRAELIAWKLRLGITDAWRNWWPDKREFTGPDRKNRIDYVFLSPSLLSDYLVVISHVTDKRFHREDIYNQFFKPSSHCTPYLEMPSVDLTKPVCATCAGIQFRSIV
ncbi:hypothetical protein PsorP6_006098 [Peronosclerospora sorghi]|uniref:Uncharacterized protein n=1 Tax=Peronosclerospora sorghi TaxID=230839 RepID=A0ACC0W3F3_9STRA|nr:hypothetical protein PsorP6_006098 [Peronosclerospora sorghi]